MFFYWDGRGIKCCPYCGILLTPDTLKLVPCPACGRSPEKHIGGVYPYWSCPDAGCFVYGPFNDPTGEKWNKAFGPRKRIDKEEVALRIYAAYMTEDQWRGGWMGMNRIIEIITKVEEESA